MSESLPLGLAQQEKARSVDPDQLEQFGKKAAALYQECGKPLTDAVVDVVKEAMLAPEQVKRVCEFANTTAYLAMFEKAGHVRNVTFEGGPANPARVLQDLNDGSSPALNQEFSDFKKTASSYKTAVTLDILAAAFGIKEGLDKVAASVHQSHASPVDDLWDTHGALEAIRHDLNIKLSGARIMLDDVTADLCKSAEQEAMAGCSMGDIVCAWATYSTQPDMVKAAASAVRDHLLAHGHANCAVHKSFLKMAHKGHVPNEQHPLVIKFAAFQKAAHAVKVLEDAGTQTVEQLHTINKAISTMLE